MGNASSGSKVLTCSVYPTCPGFSCRAEPRELVGALVAFNSGMALDPAELDARTTGEPVADLLHECGILSGLPALGQMQNPCAALGVVGPVVDLALTCRSPGVGLSLTQLKLSPLGPARGVLSLWLWATHSFKWQQPLEASAAGPCRHRRAAHCSSCGLLVPPSTPHRPYRCSSRHRPSY